jgi:hypothetical protein
MLLNAVSYPYADLRIALLNAVILWYADLRIVLLNIIIGPLTC